MQAGGWRLLGGDGEASGARGFRHCLGIGRGAPLCGALLVQLRQGGWAPLAMCPHILGTHRLTLVQEAVPAGAPAAAGAGGTSQPQPSEQHLLHLGAHPVLCAVEISGCAQVDSEIINVLSYHGTHRNSQS